MKILEIIQIIDCNECGGGGATHTGFKCQTCNGDGKIKGNHLECNIPDELVEKIKEKCDLFLGITSDIDDSISSINNKL